MRRSMPRDVDGVMRRALTLLVALAALASSGAAQQPTPGGKDSVLSVTVAGVVTDTAGRLLPGAEVRLGTSTTIADEEARFVVAGLTPGSIDLHVRSIGYQPVARTLEVEPGLRVDVAIRLTPSAVELGTVVVEGVRMSTRLLHMGFYHRQKVGSGRFFDREALERHGGTLSGLLQEVPAVRVMRDPQGRGHLLGRSATRTCRMSVYLDGLLIRWAAETGIDHVVARQDILGLEVYPSAVQVPAQLSVPQAAGPGMSGPAGIGSAGLADCGAVVIWTKPPGG